MLYFRKVFDIYNPNCPIKNKKHKIKKMLSCVPIYDSKDINKHNPVIHKGVYPIGFVTNKIKECNGIYYAKCEMNRNDEYKNYHFENYIIDYSMDDMELINISAIIFKDIYKDENKENL